MRERGRARQRVGASERERSPAPANRRYRTRESGSVGIQRRRGSDLDQWRSRLFSVHLGNINPVGPDKDLLAMVWKYGRVLDSYFPPSRAVSQNLKYGFVRFKEKLEALQVIKALDGFLWNNRRIKASFAFPHKLSSHPLTKPSGPYFADVLERKAACESLPPPLPPNCHLIPPSSNPTSSPLTPVLPLVLLKEDLESDWLSHCATAEIIHPANIPNLHNLLRHNGLVQFSVSFLGGSKVLLIFESRTEMLVMLEKEKSRLNVFFDYVTPWSHDDIAFDHYVWLKVEHIPLHAWDLFFSRK